MSARKYVSIDPGGTTGWAIKEEDEFRHGVFQNNEHHQYLWDFLYYEHFNSPNPRIDQIICERFNYQRRPVDKGVSLELISREYIGVCKLFSQMYGVPLYMAQVPNKDFFNDRNLRDLNLYFPTIHERDAVSHLLWFLTHEERDLTYLKVKK